MVIKMHKFTDSESLTLDYAKAIGIFFVVLGHYDASVMNLFKPYTFHMPLFFLIGGLTVNYNKPLKSFMKTVFKSLVIYAAITYCITGVISEIISAEYNLPVFGNAFITDPLTTIITAFKYNFANNRLFVVAWFLLAYTFASFMCVILCKSLKKLNIEGGGAVIFCSGVLIGFMAIDVFSKGEMYQAKNLMIQTMVSLMFFMMGCALREYMQLFSSPLLALSACIIVYLLRSHGVTSDFIMSLSIYPYGAVVTITQSLCGIYLVMFFSKILSGSDYQWILFIGRRTKTIMSYHILSFIVLDIVFYKAGMYDIKKSDAFIHFKSWYSMPLYVSFAIAMPAIANYIYSTIRNFVKPLSMLSQKNT